ncbi:phosphonatase-like hydrolase [Ammonicoccus fulvus]|uniref:Phosphonatase-like hydrolase n=1 Tax=Ammonicoccus fulvus TaxID=3138240 RepID=A0ABZ3FNB9_9ACTN
MNNTDPISLVVFDMAGTTIDEGGLVYDVLRRVTEDAGARYDDDTFLAHTGTEKRGAVASLLVAGGIPADEDRVDVVHGRFVRELAEGYGTHPPQPIPGVETTFERLRTSGVKVALSTGYDRPTADLLLDALGWSEGETVDLIVCATEVAQGRPAPDMILRAMSVFGIRNPRAVMAVGDTPADLQAAHRAGVTGVGVLTGAGDRTTLGREPHHYLVPSVAAVAGVVLGPDLG